MIPDAPAMFHGAGANVVILPKDSGIAADVPCDRRGECRRSASFVVRGSPGWVGRPVNVRVLTIPRPK